LAIQANDLGFAGGGPGGRRLIAVLHADMVGYSRHIGQDVTETVSRLRAIREELIDPAIQSFGGRLVHTGGDSLLVAFDSIDGALRCAMEMQRGMPRFDIGYPPERWIRFRVGLSIADVIAEGGDLHGDGVNIAARLQAECSPGDICVSRAVHDHVAGNVGLAFEPLGVLTLKNIPHPVAAFVLRVATEHAGASDPHANLAATGAQVTTRARGSHPSIAILPFTNLSGDAEQAYFADGIVEDIIVSLTGLQELMVISRSSTMSYAGRHVDAREVGRGLGVRYVLRGSVRRSTNAIRVSSELVDTQSGVTLWADTHHGPLGDLFELQDRIVRRIVSGIAPQIREHVLRRALRRHPSSMTAYDLTLQALYLMEQVNPEKYSKARPLLARAMEVDPDFAMPAAWAVWWHVRNIGQGWSTDVEADSRQAAELARHAVNVDPHNALALAMQGHLNSFLLHDYDSALNFFDRALTAGPNHALVVLLHAATLAYVGRGDEAVAAAERAMRLSPSDRNMFLFYNVTAWARYAQGSFQEAVRLARMAAKAAPVFTANLRVFIAALVANGDLPEAIEVAAELLRLEPEFSLSAYVRRRQPFRDGPIKVRYIAHLQEAGLPS